MKSVVNFPLRAVAEADDATSLVLSQEMTLERVYQISEIRKAEERY